jgi:glutathione S-transferase
MLTLYQAEWCPHSHRVRRRLTELGVAVHLEQVEPKPEQRHALRERSGDDSIPQLETEDGTFVRGDRAILAYLEARFDEPAAAAGHRAQERKQERTQAA